MRVTLIGAATAILGGFVYLSNVGQHFYLVQAAAIYDGGCTVCAQQAITGATATFSAASSDSVTGYLILVGVLISSLVMLRSRVIGKVPGSLGLLFVGYSIVNATVLNQGSGMIYSDLAQLPFALFGLWIFAVGVGVFRVRSGFGPDSARGPQVQAPT
jgi:hypothetical protein